MKPNLRILFLLFSVWKILHKTGRCIVVGFDLYVALIQDNQHIGKIVLDRITPNIGPAVYIHKIRSTL